MSDTICEFNHTNLSPQSAMPIWEYTEDNSDFCDLCMSGDLSAVHEIVLKNPEIVNCERNKNKTIPIILAAHANQYSIVDFLAKFTDFNKFTTYGWSLIFDDLLNLYLYHETIYSKFEMYNKEKLNIEILKLFVQNVPALKNLDHFVNFFKIEYSPDNFKFYQTFRFLYQHNIYSHSDFIHSTKFTPCQREMIIGLP